MEDASKHASTQQALITVSAAKGSACTQTDGPASVRSLPKPPKHSLGTNLTLMKLNANTV